MTIRRGKKILLLALFLVSLTILILGCDKLDEATIEVDDPASSNNECVINEESSENKTLKKENEELKQKILALEQEIEDLSKLNNNYTAYPEKHRLLPKEVKLYSSPHEIYEHFRTIPENTVVEVITAVCLEQEKLWLYIYSPNLRDFVLSESYGWILADATVAYTVENQKLAQRIITVKKGTKVYDATEYEFKDIPKATPMELSSNTYGEIVERKEEFVKLMSPGLFSFWVEEKHIIYPGIN